MTDLSESLLHEWGVLEKVCRRHVSAAVYKRFETWLGNACQGSLHEPASEILCQVLTSLHEWVSQQWVCWLRMPVPCMSMFIPRQVLVPWGWQQPVREGERLCSVSVLVSVLVCPVSEHSCCVHSVTFDCICSGALWVATVSDRQKRTGYGFQSHQRRTALNQNIQLQSLCDSMSPLIKAVRSWILDLTFKGQRSKL